VAVLALEVVQLVLAAVQRSAAVLQKELAGDTAVAVVVQLASAAVRLASEVVVPASRPTMGHLVPAVRTKSVST
jgi:hypothetical protein